MGNMMRAKQAPPQEFIEPQESGGEQKANGLGEETKRKPCLTLRSF